MKDTLIKMYEADIAKAKFNISVYFKNPAGIGEHPDLIQAVDSQLELMATAEWSEPMPEENIKKKKT